MKVQFRLKPFSVRFALPFTTSKGALTHREGLYVVAESDKGTVGAGEVAPLQGFSNESLAIADLCARTLADNMSETDIPEEFDQLTELIPSLYTDDIPPSVTFGFETAICDIIAKRTNVPFANLFDRAVVSHVPVNAVISGSVESIRAQLAAGLPDGISTIKIKVGEQSSSDDIERVRVVRDLVGHDVQIRLDANRAWDLDTASNILRDLSDIGLEYVEEPLRDPELRSIDYLHSKSGVHLALDESVMDENMFRELVKSDSVAAVILKPSVLGGITRSREQFEVAKSYGKKAVVTSTFETGIGVTACLHLAASLGDSPLPCGLDTLRYLSSSNINERLQILDGCIELPKKSGLGVTLGQEFLS